MGENTIFQSDVSDIGEDDDYSAFRYSFGMAIYLQEMIYEGRAQGFFVINFFVNLPDNWGVGGTIGGSTNLESEDGGFFGSIPGFLYIYTIIPLAFVPRIRKRSK